MNYDDEKYRASLHDNVWEPFLPISQKPSHQLWHKQVKADRKQRGKQRGMVAARLLTLLLLASALVSGWHIDDAVSINVKGHLDLWHTTRCWWDSNLLQKLQFSANASFIPQTQPQKLLFSSRCVRMCVKVCKNFSLTENNVEKFYSFFFPSFFFKHKITSSTSRKKKKSTHTHTHTHKFLLTTCPNICLYQHSMLLAAAQSWTQTWILLFYPPPLPIPPTALTSVNCPSSLLSLAISRSPWCTLISTWVWPSAAVEKICDFLVGIVVLRLMSLVNTPPNVSIPRDSGVTSSSKTSVTSPASTPPYAQIFHAFICVELSPHTPTKHTHACTHAQTHIHTTYAHHLHKIRLSQLLSMGGIRLKSESWKVKNHTPQKMHLNTIFTAF